jgi:hypothetical protein
MWKLLRWPHFLLNTIFHLIHLVELIKSVCLDSKIASNVQIGCTKTTEICERLHRTVCWNYEMPKIFNNYWWQRRCKLRKISTHRYFVILISVKSQWILLHDQGLKSAT